MADFDDDIDTLKEAHLKRERDTGKKEFKFEIGRNAISDAVANKMERTKKELRENDRTPQGSFTGYVWDSFARHCLCDWGDISAEEKEENVRALANGGQLCSVYNSDVYPSITIWTEEDRSETIVALSSEVKKIC